MIATERRLVRAGQIGHIRGGHELDRSVRLARVRAPRTTADVIAAIAAAISAGFAIGGEE